MRLRGFPHKNSKFYFADLPFERCLLLQEGEFNFSDVVQSYAQRVGLNYPSSEAWDLRVTANKAEHFTGIAALNAFRVHPARTVNMEEADLFVVGVPVYVSFLAGQLRNCNQGRYCHTTHKQRMDRLSDAITAHPMYKRYYGHNFLLVLTALNTVDVLKGTNNTGISQLTGWRTGVDDECIRNYAGPPPLNENNKPIIGASQNAPMLTIPYRAHFRLEEEAKRYYNEQADCFVTESRPVSYFFHGNFNRRNQGRFRVLLKEMAKTAWPNAVVKESVFANLKSRNPNSILQWNEVQNKTVDTMLKSKFCLVPEGDTPSSRRLFEALAAGCIPVLFGELDKIMSNLPFLNAIDWPSVAIFAGSLSCIGGVSSENYTHNRNKAINLTELPSLGDATARYFAAASHVYSDLRCMQARGRRVFATRLSYATGGFVTGILSEIEARFVR